MSHRVYRWFTFQVYSDMENKQPKWTGVAPIKIKDDDFERELLDFLDKIQCKGFGREYIRDWQKPIQSSASTARKRT